MKIQIQCNDPSGCKGYEIIDLENRKHIENHKSNLFLRFFDEEDILNLLGEKKYKQFESGKYEFDVTKKQIFEVTQNISYFTLPK